MSQKYYFMIVSEDDRPIYELSFLPSEDDDTEDNRHLYQLFLSSGLDSIDTKLWNSNSMYLDIVDQYNKDRYISAYVTASNTRFVLLHFTKQNDAIKAFFQTVHELFVKLVLNPFYVPGRELASRPFDARVRAAFDKYLQ